MALSDIYVLEKTISNREDVIKNYKRYNIPEDSLPELKKNLEYFKDQLLIALLKSLTRE